MKTKKYNYIDYVKILLDRGPGFFIGYFINNFWFDFKRGVDTHKRQSIEEYDTKPKDFDQGIWYVSVKTSTLNTIFNCLKTHLGNDIANYQFVDLGCGKGKSLIYFIENFGKITRHKAIGLEYDHKLANIALANLNKVELNEQTEVVTRDAREFHQYITSNKLIIYMYNPFNWQVMKDVLKTIKENNYEVLICYIDPLHSAQIQKEGYSILQKSEGKYPADHIHILKK